MLSPIEVSPIKNVSGKSVQQKVVEKSKEHIKIKSSSSKHSKPSSSLHSVNSTQLGSDRKQKKIDLNQNVSLHKIFPAKKSEPPKDDDDDVICID